MNNAVKISLIIAGCLIGTGIIIAAVAALIIGINAGGHKGSTELITKTYAVSESFESISIDSKTDDIEIVTSSDDEIRIEADESDGITHKVEVKNNTLSISQTDNRPFFEHIFSLSGNGHRVTVYVPSGHYEKLTLRSVSGDITTAEDIKCNTAEISVISGDITFVSQVSTKISVSSTGGDIKLDGIVTKELSPYGTIENNIHNAEVTATSISGDIKLSGFGCMTLYTSTTSGEVEMNDIDAQNISSKTVSGNITLDKCTALKLDLESVSGDIGGKLLGHKIYSTSTVSGNVDVPKSSGTDTCNIKTVSGNIEFE